MGGGISVVVPTLNGGVAFEHLCSHLARLREHRDVDVLVIDSGSRDDTVRHAREAGLRVHSIPSTEFGHGRTRNLGVQLTTGDIICFLTQDVLPCTPDWPERFAAALAEPAVAGVYGRQVPRDAKAMEMFFVALNYPPESLRFTPRAGGHHPRPGRVLFSNAFSAVRRDIIEAVPFADDAQFSEDQMWAHQALAAGYSIVYEPAAEALHAHRYSMSGLFRRSYEVGRALRGHGIDAGATFSESVRFLATEVAYFVRQGHMHRLPQLLPYEFVRWAGFQAGRRGWASLGPAARQRTARFNLVRRARPEQSSEERADT
jgi:rhamnosyltransferase